MRSVSRPAAMRQYVPIIAWLVLYAHAASISNKPEARTDDNVNIDDVSESEQINKNEADIPVNIIKDGCKKLDVNSNDYVPTDYDSNNIKRFEIDLENPGLPQHQEHETQNPENFGNADKALVAVKLKVEEAQNIFKEELKKISKDFETIFTEKKDLPNILKSLQNVKSTVSRKIAEVDKSIETNLFPDSTKTKTAIEKNILKSKLKLAEKDFEMSVQTLSEGVEFLSNIQEKYQIKQANDESSPTSAPNESTNAQTVAPTSAENQTQASSNPFILFIQNALNNLSSYFQQYTNVNVNSTNSNNISGSNNNGNFFTNLFPNNQGQVVQPNQQASQSDEPVTQTSLIQQMQASILNYFNQTIIPNFSQTVNGIVSYIRPNPSTSAPADTQNSASGQNEVPNTPAAETTMGPIQSFIQNNPIRKRIEQAIQTLQNNVSPNPEKPGEPIKHDTTPNQSPAAEEPTSGPIQNNPIHEGIEQAVKKVEVNTVTKPEEEKPKELIPNDTKPKGHHGGHGGQNNQGDNNNSNGVKADEPEIAETVSDILQESEPEEPVKEAISPPAFSEKTE